MGARKTHDRARRISLLSVFIYMLKNSNNPAFDAFFRDDQPGDQKIPAR